MGEILSRDLYIYVKKILARENGKKKIKALIIYKPMISNVKNEKKNHN